MKRFQECSNIVKLWRYRWYIPIPFMYSWFVIKSIFIPIDFTPREYLAILTGDAQFRMSWYYTAEEVNENIKRKLKAYKNGNK